MTETILKPPHTTSNPNQCSGHYTYPHAMGLLIALMFIVFGCGSPTPQTTVIIPESSQRVIVKPPPPIDDNLSNLAPAGYQHATWIQLPNLRRSPLWEFAKTLSEEQFFKTVNQAAKMDILAATSEILIISGHKETSTTDEFVAIIKGELNTSRLMTHLRAHEGVTNITILTTDALQKGRLVFAPITESTFLLGNRSIVEESVRLSRRQGKSITATPGFNDFAPQPRDGAIIRYVKGESTLNMSMFSSPPLNQFRWLQSATVVDGSVNLANGLRLNSTVQMETQNQAADVTQYLKGQLKQAFRNPFVSLLQLGWLKTRIKIHQDLNNVQLSSVLTEQDIMELNKVIDPLLRIRQMMETDSTPQ